MSAAITSLLSFLFQIFSLFLASIQQKIISRVRSRYSLLQKVINVWLEGGDILPSSTKSAPSQEKPLNQLGAKVPFYAAPWSKCLPHSTLRAKIQLVQADIPHVQAAETVEAALVVEDPEDIRKSSCSKTTTRINHKRSMSSIDLKLDEYNARNCQYIICKHLQKHRADSRCPCLLQEVDYSAICQSIHPSTNPRILSKISNLPKSRLYKHRKHASFEPTKLSAIFENLAY